MSITANTTDSPLDYYYYFYRWVVESPCAPLSGLEGGESMGFDVYPNPVAHGFQWSCMEGPADLVWLDMAGREVALIRGVSPGWVARPALGAGQYVLVAITEKGTQRMLVQFD